MKILLFLMAGALTIMVLAFVLIHKYLNTRDEYWWGEH
jgi:hypothetical protein